MRNVLATIIVVGAIIPAVAFGNTNDTNNGGTKANAPVAKKVTKKKARCNSNACHRRVAIKKKARLRASCKSKACKRRVARKQYRAALKGINAQKLAVIAPYRGWLASTRRCESGGNYSTNTGNGFYGAYQFMAGTWHSVGGSGLPHNASPLEQDYRAVLLLKRSGAGQWPVCGH